MSGSEDTKIVSYILSCKVGYYFSVFQIKYYCNIVELRSRVRLGMDHGTNSNLASLHENLSAEVTKLVRWEAETVVLKRDQVSKRRPWIQGCLMMYSLLIY